jgi:hypothetical protein
MFLSDASTQLSAASELYEGMNFPTSQVLSFDEAAKRLEQDKAAMP